MEPQHPTLAEGENTEEEEQLNPPLEDDSMPTGPQVPTQRAPNTTTGGQTTQREELACQWKLTARLRRLGHSIPPRGNPLIWLPIPTLKGKITLMR